MKKIPFPGFNPSSFIRFHPPPHPLNATHFTGHIAGLIWGWQKVISQKMTGRHKTYKTLQFAICNENVSWEIPSTNNWWLFMLFTWQLDLTSTHQLRARTHGSFVPYISRQIHARCTWKVRRICCFCAKKRICLELVGHVCPVVMTFSIGRHLCKGSSHIPQHTIEDPVLSSEDEPGSSDQNISGFTLRKSPLVKSMFLGWDQLIMILLCATKNNHFWREVHVFFVPWTSLTIKIWKPTTPS